MFKIILFVLFCNFKISAQITLTGLDVLERENYKILKNKRVGVITNHTAVDSNGFHILELFKKAGINLVAIYTPEHGFKGNVEGGVYIENSSQSVYNVPIYSLYGKNKRPTEEMLKGIDVLVFDIQDIGARFYTYLTTMGYAMEEATKYNISFIVLDRPNPVSANIIEGPVLQEGINHFTAYFPVPVRHGLTAGEIALLHKKVKNLNLDLKVIKMENYSRDKFFDETGLIWVNPSPNIRDLEAAILYSGIGCFEATNVSVGRGTDKPFHWFGAPWLNSKKILKKLEKANLKGVKFYEREKIPSADIYKGERCKGIEIKILDKREIRPLEIFVYAVYWLSKINKNEFILKKEDITRMIGSSLFYDMIKSGKKPQEIIEFFNSSNKNFPDKEILLY